MTNPRIAVVSLWAEDVPATAHFYRDVIGLRMLPHHGAHERPHFDVGGIYLTILKGRPVPAQEPIPARFPLVAFAVDDLEGAVERLRSNAVETPWGIEEDAGSRWVMFHDPAGNLMELACFKK
jgi:catechol 2,3-dioxygenase-like lactoylglutathione lyase family enzyme